MDVRIPTATSRRLLSLLATNSGYVFSSDNVFLRLLWSFPFISSGEMKRHRHRSSQLMNSIFSPMKIFRWIRPTLPLQIPVFKFSKVSDTPPGTCNSYTVPLLNRLLELPVAAAPL